ncbi:PH domain-containing protein [Streptomyces sp. NBC_00237]|uniref:PH domain-containing protein n=1 Tax=Streptomyces sp. NBC_00237 TaxID=2975687 RepID=UPI0022550B55|nr:PH domain-containing protein [Streptomyces sp. NBC_00237]MCX5204519.1 PH domain-containing protein [Streptomyces sp. NBC_00237]
MTQTLPQRRNSPAMFAMRTAEHAATIVPAVIAGVSVSARWPVLFGIPVAAVFGLLGGIIVLSLVVDWRMTTFAVDSDGIRYDSGLVVRRSTSLSWAEVVSVQVSRSAVARLLGCSRVLIGIGTESKAALVIEAVPQAVAAEMEGYFEAVPVRPSPGTPVPGTDSRAVPPAAEGPRESAETGWASGSAGETEDHSAGPGDLIYRIRVRDYLLISVTYGQFALLLPFLMELYENAAAFLPLPSVLPEISDLPGPLWAQVVIAVAVLGAVAAAFGMLIAWLRYRLFEVRLRAETFTMSGGLVSAESRRMPRSQVGGVRIQRNPLMRVTGYARLSFASRQSGERIGANIVFPAARLEHIRDSVRSHFPAYAAAVSRAPEPGRPLRWGLAGGAVATLALAAWAVHAMSLITAVILLAAVAIVLLAAINYCWAAAALDPENAVLHFRRGFLWATHYVVPWDSVYFAHSYRMSGVGRLSAGAVCLGVYDSRAVRLWVPTSSLALVDHFIEATTSGPATRGVEGTS